MSANPPDEMIEMRLLKSKQGGSERLSCSPSFWDFMVNLGETFGWQPQGASYVVASIRRGAATRAIRHDYRPGAARDAKVIDNEDASKWADALSTACASSHLDSMISAYRIVVDAQTDPDDKQLNEEFRTSMHAFIGYLRKGAFSFASKEDSNVVPFRARS